jgi:dipeptide/tripeptide permease
LKPVSIDVRGGVAKALLVLLGAMALYALLLWGTDRPVLMWSLYALLPAATCYYAVKSDGRKKALWLTMLIVSTVVSAIVGQMVSGLTLVIRDYVNPTLMGFAFPAEYFAGAFSGFIILFALILGKRSEGNDRGKKHGYAFSLGALCIAISLGIIGFALAFSDGAKMSAWVMLGAYAFKAVAEILIIPEGLSLMHDISAKEDKSLNMAIWYLGAGLGVNLAKMLGLSMGDGWVAQSFFFRMEAVAVAIIALVLWLIAPWIARSVAEIQTARLEVK